jgi:hypothetical protein
MDGSTAVSSTIHETPEDDHVGRKMWYAYTSEVDEILTLKTFEGF